MKTSIFSLICFLTIVWSVVSAQEVKASAILASEKQDGCLTQKKHEKNSREDFDLDALIEKYNKYEAIMAQLGLAHHGQHPSGLGKLLRYMSVPVGLASWFYAATNLVYCDNDKPFGWAASFSIATFAYLLCLYLGDALENSQEALHAKGAAAKLVKMYEEQKDSFPEELKPVAELLQQHADQNGKFDLQDRLLTSLIDEIIREHRLTRDELHKCIDQVNAELFA